jgi:hypothetical protein
MIKMFDRLIRFVLLERNLQMLAKIKQKTTKLFFINREIQTFLKSNLLS